MMIFNHQMLNLLATPLYLVVIGAELLISNIHQTRTYTWKDTLQNISLSILSGLTDLITRALAMGVLVFFFSFRLWSLEKSWWYWVLLVLLVDFLHYLLHRLSHSSRFFWAVHIVHHSSPQFNLSVGFRSAVLESLYRFLFFIPAAILGFAPLDIFFVYSACEIWTVLTHTEKLGRLGWLEYFMVTPSHHRVHHASNPLYLDRNMGSVFIFWDKLLGSFQPELGEQQYEPIRYGLVHGKEQHGLSEVLFAEWRSIWHDVRRPGLRIRERWMYAFGPPGWSHDGSRQTSSQLRAATRKKLNRRRIWLPDQRVRTAS